MSAFNEHESIHTIDGKQYLEIDVKLYPDNVSEESENMPEEESEPSPDNVSEESEIMPKEESEPPPNNLSSKYQMIPVSQVTPFSDSPFKLYEDERLEDMVDSIKKYGLINPVIVRRIESGYQMLSGHNRLEAAKKAGLSEIPAIVKEELSDYEALAYVYETNLRQRSFDDLMVSEKIAVLSNRYDQICSERRLKEIQEELDILEGCGHEVHPREKSRDRLGQNYGMSGRQLARYIRCDHLIPAFKDKLDDKSLTLTVGVELSYLSEDEQELVLKVMDNNKSKLNLDSAQSLKENAGNLTEESVIGILKPNNSAKNVREQVNVKLPKEVYKRYFENKKKEDVSKILEEALDYYFQNANVMDNHVDQLQ